MARPKSVPTPAQVASKAITALETVNKSVAAVCEALADLPESPLAFLSAETNDQIAKARELAVKVAG